MLGPSSLARPHFNSEPSLPVCTEPRDQLEVKAYGFLRSVLSMCPALGIHMVSRFPNISENFSKMLFPSKISLLGFSSCTFGCLLLTQTITLCPREQ